MLGLVALGLTVVMIYTLVKNALIGTQLNAKDEFTGTIELCIPITQNSEFHFEDWDAALSNLQYYPTNLKIHLLIDGHHPLINRWQELQQKHSLVEIHSFITRPDSKPAIPWMIEQMVPKITSDVVVIGDPELVPSEFCFRSIGKITSDKKKPFFILPQTRRQNVWGEAIATINPTLTLASFFGLRKMRRNISHSLISLSQGWMAMPLEAFVSFSWQEVKNQSWKEALAKNWDSQNKSYLLAFGEKHLLRYYPADIKIQINQMKLFWDECFSKSEKLGTWIYLACLFIWSFPLISFLTHPFWALASIMLLILFRFFAKIVFQDSWGSMLLHPFGCIVWIGTFFHWGYTGLMARYGAKKPVSNSKTIGE